MKFTCGYKFDPMMKRLAQILVGTKEYHRMDPGYWKETYMLGTSNNYWVDVERGGEVEVYTLKFRYCTAQFADSLEFVLMRLIGIKLE